MSTKRDPKEFIERVRQDIDSWRPDSEKVMEYLSWASRFHDYSPFNLLMIKQQMPHATRVASFGFWKRSGRRITSGKGSGLSIYRPMYGKVTVEDEDGNEVEEKRYFGPRLTTVFDISQTEGDDLPEPDLPKGFGDEESLGQARESLTRIAERRSIELAVEQMDPGVSVLCSTGLVRVNASLDPHAQMYYWAQGIARELLDSGFLESRIPEEDNDESPELLPDFIAMSYLLRFGVPGIEHVMSQHLARAIPSSVELSRLLPEAVRLSEILVGLDEGIPIEWLAAII